jgi:hypothetical protein
LQHDLHYYHYFASSFDLGHTVKCVNCDDKSFIKLTTVANFIKRFAA